MVIKNFLQSPFFSFLMLAITKIIMVQNVKVADIRRLENIEP